MTLQGSQIEVYQFRIWLKQISPMIWRRLLVRSDSSIADLHHYLQIIMGWEDIHLNQFTIRAKVYGVYHTGGISFSDNPNEAKLSDFQFYINERFTYEYDFFAHWEHEIRFEQRLPINQNKIYPICIGGKRMAPPEECGGAYKFMDLEEHYEPLNQLFKIREAFEEYQEGEREAEDIDEMLVNLRDWEDRAKFNRRTINKQLQEYVNCNHNNGGIYESEDSSNY